MILMILMILQSDDEKESIERSKMFKNYQKKIINTCYIII
tara:strand:+ start:68851 stop:68970 length:120 start_codon:yes stop_codon:yes gene_type:complete